MTLYSNWLLRLLASIPVLVLLLLFGLLLLLIFLVLLLVLPLVLLLILLLIPLLVLFVLLLVLLHVLLFLVLVLLLLLHNSSSVDPCVSSSVAPGSSSAMGRLAGRLSLSLLISSQGATFTRWMCPTGELPSSIVHQSAPTSPSAHHPTTTPHIRTKGAH